VSLYTLLTAARGRQLLTERGWSEGLDFSAAESGGKLMLAGTVSTLALVALLPCLASRGRLEPTNVSGLQLLCENFGSTLRITGSVYGDEMCFNTVLIDVPAEHELCRHTLISALQDDLAAVSKVLAEDADTILSLTGAQYEGTVIFERETRHFIVVAESWDELPDSVKPDEVLTEYWLNEILCHGSAVLSVGLAVIRNYGMLRMGEISLPEVCVIRPGTPVRHWLPRQSMSMLATKVRHIIDIHREITASFAPR
jgi:hypothetical protein